MGVLLNFVVVCILLKEVFGNAEVNLFLVVENIKKCLIR